MTTEDNGQTESADELVEDQAVPPRDPEPAEETDVERGDQVAEGSGPDSENVDGEAQARNAKETGGYGY